MWHTPDQLFDLLPFLGVCLLIVLLLVFFGSRKAPGYRFFAGMWGEKSVASALRSLGSGYRVLNDLLLRSGSTTCQVDHVVVSKYGIFVIETKNFKGTVTGSDQARCWSWDGGDGTKTFYSPVEQNDRHVEVLSSVLGLSRELFVPVVVFTGKAHIWLDTSHFVLFLGQLVPFIRVFRRQVIDEACLRPIAERLQQLNITDERVREAHVVNARRAARR